MIMQIIGTVIAAAIILGLIVLMGKMSEQGSDINKNFCTGNCSDCGLSDELTALGECGGKDYNNLLTYERGERE